MQIIKKIIGKIMKIKSVIFVILAYEVFFMIKNSVNIKNENKHFIFFSIGFNSFLRRVLIMFLVIIIAFTSAFKSTEKETNALLIEISLIVGIVSGIVLTAAECYSLYKDVTGEDEESCDAFFDDNVSLNSDGSFVLSDEALEMINDMLSKYKEEVTYVDSYFAKSYNLPAGEFTNRNTYLMYQALIQNNTTYIFKFAYSRGETTITLADGTSKKITSGKRIWAMPVPFAAVSSSYSNNQFKAILYDDAWSNYIDVIEFVAVDSTSEAVFYYQKEDGLWYELRTAHEVEELDLVDVTSVYHGYDFSTYLGNSQKSFNSGVTNTQMNQTFFSNFTGAIPCFKSVAAMKNGTSNGLKGQYMPNYTGQPVTQNTITQQEINDFSTNYNYYYGSDSGSSGSGSGSGSSGGSWIDNIVSGLTNLGSGILTIISKVFEIITEILEFFTETLADVIDIIPTGFTQFLGALFPFFPEEWITGFSLFLTLLLIGAAIKIFVK